MMTKQELINTLKSLGDVISEEAHNEYVECGYVDKYFLNLCADICHMCIKIDNNFDDDLHLTR